MIYVEGLGGAVEFDEELGDFTLLEDQNFGNSPVEGELVEDEFVGEFEDDGLVDADEKNFGGLLTIGFLVTEGRVICAIAHILLIIIRPKIIKLISFFIIT